MIIIIYNYIFKNILAVNMIVFGTDDQIKLSKKYHQLKNIFGYELLQMLMTLQL
jgi:hypothetical protein